MFIISPGYIIRKLPDVNKAHHGNPVRSWNPSSIEITARTGKKESSPLVLPAVTCSMPFKSSESTWDSLPRLSPSCTISESSSGEQVEKARERKAPKNAWEFERVRKWDVQMSNGDDGGGGGGNAVCGVNGRRLRLMSWDNMGREEDGRERRRWEKSADVAMGNARGVGFELNNYIDLLALMGRLNWAQIVSRLIKCRSIQFSRLKIFWLELDICDLQIGG